MVGMKRILLLLVILLAGFAEGATYNCSTCADCTGKIENASAGDTVYLVVNITNRSGSCVTVSGVGGLTFDCMNNSIVGTSSNFGNHSIWNFTTNGIFISTSPENIIKNCKVSLFDFGVHLADSSDKNTIQNIEATHNVYGIFVWTSLYSAIQDSIVNSNEFGIHLPPRASANNITRNMICCNTHTGIYIHGKCYGGCSVFYQNNIINNSIQADSAIQADSDDDLHLWDNGVEGNYWSDYSGSDLDGNGVGDTPHNVSTVDYQDNYPLMEPYGECSVKGDVYPCDGVIFDYELLTHITSWARGLVSDFSLLDAIDNWSQ